MPDNASTSALDHCLLTGPPGAPVVVVLGGISAGRDVRGWWSGVVGDGRPVNTREFRVLGADFLDGGERADGRPERTVTTHLSRLYAKLDVANRTEAIALAIRTGLVSPAIEQTQV